MTELFSPLEVDPATWVQIQNQDVYISQNALVWFLELINLHGLFNVKAILVEEQWWYYCLSTALVGGDNGIHTFPLGFSPKVKVLAHLEFEFASYNIAVKLVDHYVTRTLSLHRSERYRSNYSYSIAVDEL